MRREVEPRVSKFHHSSMNDSDMLHSNRVEFKFALIEGLWHYLIHLELLWKLVENSQLAKDSTINVLYDTVR